MESLIKVNVHPVTLFSIVDSYERRNEDQERVVGTLLGIVDKGVVDITNCFAVPHNETASDVAMDLEFGNNMLKLIKKVNPNEVVVGWYSTGSEVSEHSMLIHQDIYMQHTKSPILLLVDTSLRSDKMDIKAYVSKSMGAPGRTLGFMFIPLTVNIECYEAEKSAVDMMQEGLMNKRRITQLKDDLTHLVEMTIRLQKMLAQVLKYVEDVVEKKRPADHHIGRSLAQVILAVPNVDMEKFDEMVNSSMKDLLMITYLTTLIKTHLKINEKLMNLV